MNRRWGGNKVDVVGGGGVVNRNGLKKVVVVLGVGVGVMVVVVVGGVVVMMGERIPTASSLEEDGEGWAWTRLSFVVASAEGLGSDSSDSDVTVGRAASAKL